MYSNKNITIAIKMYHNWEITISVVDHNIFNTTNSSSQFCLLTIRAHMIAGIPNARERRSSKPHIIVTVTTRAMKE